nr:BspA family leucine-rich repeat surface protein [Lachnospiraceae bacterium]
GKKAYMMVLRKYKGKASNLTIPAYAVVDGHEYHVIMYGSVFGSNNTLKSVDLSKMGTAGHTNDGGYLKALFVNCSKLERADISNLHITNASGMFSGCRNLQFIYSEGIATSNACNASAMFNGCSSLKSIDVSSFNNASFSEMTGMFGGCMSLTSIDISTWNIYEDADMSSMFEDCVSLKTAVLNSTSDNGKSNTSYMFKNCTKLEKVIIKQRFRMSGCQYMFSGCLSLRSIDLTGLILCYGSCSDFFNGCEKLVEIMTPKEKAEYNASRIELPHPFWYPDEWVPPSGSPQNYYYLNGCPLGVTIKRKETVIVGKKGDVTGDGDVGMGDVVKVARAVNGSLTLTDEEIELADVTGDREVGMGDVVKIARFVSGSIDSL